MHPESRRQATRKEQWCDVVVRGNTNTRKLKRSHDFVYAYSINIIQHFQGMFSPLGAWRFLDGAYTFVGPITSDVLGLYFVSSRTQCFHKVSVYELSKRKDDSLSMYVKVAVSPATVAMSTMSPPTQVDVLSTFRYVSMDGARCLWARTSRPRLI